MKSAACLALLAAIAFSGAAAGAAEPVEGKDYSAHQPGGADLGRVEDRRDAVLLVPVPALLQVREAVRGLVRETCRGREVERAAVSIGHADWVPAAQAFYALSAMKKVPAIDDAFFGAIHGERLGR